jgi:Uma2 family endonuclease
VSGPVATGLTRADLDGFPDDGQRRELIDGELFVSPKPARRHQRVLGRVFRLLAAYEDRRGGEAILEPNDDYSQRTHLEPDVVYVAAEHAHRLSPRGVEGAPDLVVEVSSPSTRRFDLIRKRAVYEREGVAEYWFVDLEHDQIQVYRLTGGYYDEPMIVGRGETLTSPGLPGLALDVDEALGPPEG